MYWNLADLAPVERYRLMIQTIIPRPIAWTLTKNEADSYNLAPFSYFNTLHSNPPLVIISIGYKQDASKKDSRANIERDKNFVIHIPSAEHAELVTQSSLPLAYGESEVDLTGLELVNDWEKPFPLPRVKSAKIAFACKLDKVVEVGANNQGIIFGVIEQIYVTDEAVTMGDKPVIDAMKISPLARLGGDDYGVIGEVKTVPRPPYTPQ
jgi:flavin reductase (DIM6/NTAB) family NADH-FMN oxidoreductase RutF